MDERIPLATTVGYHLRGGVLIEQANATKTPANADLARFKQEGLGDADIADRDAKIDQVLKGLEDRTLATTQAYWQTGDLTALWGGAGTGKMGPPLAWRPGAVQIEMGWCWPIRSGVGCQAVHARLASAPEKRYRFACSQQVKSIWF